MLEDITFWHPEKAINKTFSSTENYEPFKGLFFQANVKSREMFAKEKRES